MRECLLSKGKPLQETLNGVGRPTDALFAFGSATTISVKTAHSSSTAENYLERILELIDAKGYARVVDIASSLGISQASVTRMIQRLDAEGLLKYEKYRGLSLTNAGERLARNIVQRHRLLTDFFKLLGLDDEVIYQDVEGIEHHISDSSLCAIEALTAELQRQPALLARVKARQSSPAQPSTSSGLVER